MRFLPIHVKKLCIIEKLGNEGGKMLMMGIMEFQTKPYRYSIQFCNLRASDGLYLSVEYCTSWDLLVPVYHRKVRENWVSYPFGTVHRARRCSDE